MLSRTLTTATVTLLIACFGAIPVRAQNLEAGKSPSQIFAGTCSACHKSSRGLLKTVAPGSLPSFLRQHYTTSSDMASLLSAYLISNGATDTRYGVVPPKPAREAKQEPAAAAEPVEPRQGRRARRGAEPQEAAKPDADGLSPREAAAAARAARRAKQLKPVLEIPDAATPEGEAKPATAAADEDPLQGRGAGKQKLGKKGKHGREQRKIDAAKFERSRGEPKDEPRKDEPRKDGLLEGDTAIIEPPPKFDAGKIDATRGEGIKPEPSISDGESTLRADPVPTLSPAPKSSEDFAAPVQSAIPEMSSPASAPPAAANRSADDFGSAASAPAAAPTVHLPPAIVTSSPPSRSGPPVPPISE
jgi:hypothetical protein